MNSVKFSSALRSFALAAAISACGAKTSLKIIDPLLDSAVADSPSVPDASSDRGRCTILPSRCVSSSIRIVRSVDSSSVSAVGSTSVSVSLFISINTDDVVKSVNFSPPFSASQYSPNSTITTFSPYSSAVGPFAVIRMDPNQIILAKFSRSASLSAGQGIDFDCLSFRNATSDPQNPRLSVFDLVASNPISNVPVPFGSVTTFIFDGFVPFRFSSFSASSGNTGFMLLDEVVSISSDGRVEVNGSPLTHVRGTIYSSGTEVRGYSLSQNNSGTETICP